jgi:predicted NUDIX family phosphoesterase
MDEKVLVIPASHFEKIGLFTGFLAHKPDYITQLLDPKVFSFEPRSQCETDPSYKQLIPYIILRNDNQLFHYRRGGSGSEKRLQSKRSIGIGGHISEADAVGPYDLYRNGMLREISEEVSIDSEYSERMIGLIYDPSTPVGEVHLGVVHIFDLKSVNAKSKESALADSGFSSRLELMQYYSEFETWSQLALDQLAM